MGFVRRVFPDTKMQKQIGINFNSIAQSNYKNSTESLQEEIIPNFGATELTFDFHRLNILLLRGMSKDGVVVGKKICTATMSEAKIQATVGRIFCFI